MPRSKEVKISNGEIEAVVLEESVPAYERNGWTVVEDGSSEEATVSEVHAQGGPQAQQPQQVAPAEQQKVARPSAETNKE